MNLLICYGTRPEWIKVKPIIDELSKSNIRYKTLFTGQHKDLVLNKADYNLPDIVDVSSNRLDNIVSSIFKSVDEIIDKFKGNKIEDKDEFYTVKWMKKLGINK